MSDRLDAAGSALAAEHAGDPEVLDAVRRRAAERRRHRRTATILGAAAVVAIVVGGAALGPRPDGSPVEVGPVAPTAGTLTSGTTVPGLRQDVDLPFSLPAWFDVATVTTGDGRSADPAVLYHLMELSDVVAGAPARSITIAVFLARPGDPLDDPVALAEATMSDADQRPADVGGRPAACRPDGNVDGSPWGQPDRLVLSCVVPVDDLVLQVGAEGASHEDLDLVISTFDAATARRQHPSLDP